MKSDPKYILKMLLFDKLSWLTNWKFTSCNDMYDTPNQNALVAYTRLLYLHLYMNINQAFFPVGFESFKRNTIGRRGQTKKNHHHRLYSNDFILWLLLNKASGKHVAALRILIDLVEWMGWSKRCNATFCVNMCAVMRSVLLYHCVNSAHAKHT